MTKPFSDFLQEAIDQRKAAKSSIKDTITRVGGNMHGEANDVYNS